MERPTCETCPFFCNVGEVNESEPGPWGHEGTCYRFPPTFVGPSSKQIGDLNEVDIDTWSHPRTKEKDYCGEHPSFPAYIASLKQTADAQP